MKSLVIGDINDTYLLEFCAEVMENRDDVKYDVLSITKDTSFFEKNFHVIYPHYSSKTNLFGKRIGSMLTLVSAYSVCRNYDEIIVLYVDRMSFAIRLFAQRNAKVVLCYYGSDLLRASKKALFILKGLVRKAATVVVENEHMKSSFSKIYGKKNEKKVRLAHYGTNNAKMMLDCCSKNDKVQHKNEFGINENKLSVLIGYNGHREQNHLAVISCLSNLPNEIKSAMFLVIHCGYGTESSYLNEIEEELSNCGIEYNVNTEFMVGERLLNFRFSIDVMIHWQTTDCMSASMVESMEAGSIVVNGGWLSYPDIEKFGGYYESAENEAELCNLMEKITLQYDKYKEHTAKNIGILNILRWNYDEWEAALNDIN